MTDKQRIAKLERAAKTDRAFLARLTRAFLKHVRTDLAPDAAVPETRRLVREIERRQRRPE